MTTSLFTKSFKAAGAITGYLIAKASAAGGTVEIASANTDPLIGAVDSMGVASGGMADIGLAGQGEVRAGGAIAFMDPLTANADGEAIKALPANSTQVRIIGFALAPAVDGDIIPYLIAPGCLSKASA